MGFFAGIHRANKKICEQVASSKRDIDIIMRCLIVKAKLIDEQTKRAYPEAASELESIVKEMLGR